MRHDTNNVTDTEVTAAVTVVCISADPGWGLLPCWQCCCTFRTVDCVVSPSIWDKTATSKSGNGVGVWYVPGKLRCVPRFTKLKHRHRNDRRWRCERNSLSRDRSDSVSDTADSDSQSLNCTTLFSLSQMNYRSNHRSNHCYNPLHRSRRFINQYFRLTDQKSLRISLNNHPNEKLFTRNHAMCFAEKRARMRPGCSHWSRVRRDLNTDVSVFDWHARLRIAPRWRLAVAKGLRDNCRDVGQAPARKVYTVIHHRSGQRYLKSGGPTYI